MDNTSEYKHFLFITLKKISLTVLDPKNQIFLKKEISINDLSIEDNFKTLEDFLDQYVFEIEKSLGKYIEDVFLILDYNDFFSADLSFKYNFKGSQFNINNMINSLVEVKNQFKKTIIDYKIIHMIINKFIIDGTVYSYLPNDINDNLSLEARFICLKGDIIITLKKILSKYQISPNRILCYDYLRDFKSSANENIFVTAEKILKGFNQNEIFLVNKSEKNKGFFEKFFNFFN